MKARLLFAILLAGLVFGGRSLSADVVRGYVLNPTTGVQVGGIEVAFYVEQNGQLDEILRKPTDAQGRFEFAGPFIKAGLNFSLAAFYKGAPHYTSTLEVGTQQEIILEVYEPTDDDSSLRIESHNLFLALSDGNLDVAHLVQIDNPEERTYVGQGTGDRRQVTQFLLPDGIRDLQSHAGQLIRAGGNRYFDTQPLPPGLTQITFTFSLDAHQLDDGYLHRVSYPTDRMEIFLQPASFRPDGPFQDLGVVDLHGNQYRRLQVTGLQPGQSLLIPLPLATSLRWVLKWGALSMAVLSGLLALVLAGKPAAAAPTTAIDPRVLRSYREELLTRLSRLDDAHVGREDDRHYREERERLMEQAVALFDLMEGQDGDR